MLQWNRMDDYNEAIEIFNNFFKNMLDYLEYYNNCVNIPVVEAIIKCLSFTELRI